VGLADIVSFVFVPQVKPGWLLFAAVPQLQHVPQRQPVHAVTLLLLLLLLLLLAGTLLFW
jgi:hypothetical protein